MDWLSELFTSLFGSLMGGVQVGSNLQSNMMNIKFQQSENARNRAWAEKMNEISRRDAANADTIKRNSLQAAGYSTADPSQSGASSIISSVPEGTAPQTRPLIDGDTITSIMAPSQIALAKAQALSQNANTTGQQIDNAYKDVQHQLAISQAKNNIRKSGFEGDFIVKQIDGFEEQVKLWQAQAEDYVFSSRLKSRDNEYSLERWEMEKRERAKQYDILCQTFTNLQNDGDIKEAMSRLKKVEADFAERGFNFNSSGLYGMLERVAGSNNPKKLGRDVGTALLNVIEGVQGGITSQLPETIFNLFSNGFSGFTKSMQMLQSLFAPKN